MLKNSKYFETVKYQKWFQNTHCSFVACNNSNFSFNNYYGV